MFYLTTTTQGADYAATIAEIESITMTRMDRRGWASRTKLNRFYHILKGYGFRLENDGQGIAIYFDNAESWKGRGDMWAVKHYGM